MSYCVQCGVKLEQSLETCPLCHTPVINPNLFKAQEPFEASSPKSSNFAEARGEVELAKRKDAGIWLTIVFFSTALSCLILNLTTFQGARWSPPVIGACLLLWVFFCPRMLNTRFPWSICLILDAVCIIGYEYALSRLTVDDRWFYELALPITVLTGVLFLLFILLYRFVSRAVLATALYFFIEVAFLNVGIELLIDRFLGVALKPGWSAIVFSVCAVIAIALSALLSIAGLRNTVRKRLHF